MKKKILYPIMAIVTTLTILFIAAFIIASAPVSAAEPIDNPVATISEDYIPSETSTEEEEVIVLEVVEVERVEPTTVTEAEQAYETAISRNVAASNLYDSLIGLGYEEDHPAVALALTEIENTEADCEHYDEILDKLREEAEWAKKAKEFPNATKAYLYMKNEFGWSDTVCSGIMGNLMAECGGCWTSDLNYSINSSGGFGMIQWIGGRRQQLFSIYGSNPSIESQLEFMRNELYGTNGVTRQVTASQLNEIMNASSPEECAYAFASYFERCATQHRAPRRGYARTAYEYFAN